MASVQDLYSGIISPQGGLYPGTGGAGVYDGILPGATGAPSGDLTTRTVKTVKIDPYTGMPATSGYQPASVGSPYMTATEKALLERQIAQSRTLQAGYDASGRAIAKPQVTLAGMFGRGITPQVQQTAIVPLPRVRPSWAPSTMDVAAVNNMPGPGLDDLLGYVKNNPVVPAVAAATDLGNGGSTLGPMFAPDVPKTGAAGGYVYRLGPDGTYKKVGRDPNFVNRNNSETAGDRLVARATGATSSAENQAWRERTFGGSGGSLLSS